MRISIPGKPDQITHCNCSLCSKTGFQGIYYPSDAVSINGEVDDYVRADSNPACIAQHRCRQCGIATHWTPLTDPPHERIGINARLFDPSLFADVEVRAVDGRSWPL
ncbi:MAG: GFA family protein [Sphingomicrobium sp.]